MSKLHPAVLNAASVGNGNHDALDRLHRVIRALAEHMPEEAVEKAARVQWTSYNQMSQSDKKSVLDLTERTIADFLKTVGEME